MIFIYKKFFYKFLILIFTFTFCNKDLISQCDSCPLPRHPETKALPIDGMVDIIFKNNLPPLYGVTSVKRVTIKKFGKFIQGIKAFRHINGICVDTTLELDDVDKIFSSNLGIGGVTLNVPILPAREYYYDQSKSIIKYNLISFLAGTGYFGSDVSKRKIGTDALMYNATLTIYPFKDFLGSRLKLGMGSGIHNENGRTRIPIYGSLRYYFWGGEYEEDYFNYFPSPCKFGVEGEKPVFPDNSNLIEIPTKSVYDSTVYFYLDKKIIKDKYRPYVLFNYGILLDGSFDGSGNEPSLNKEDYNQFFITLGFGMPLMEIIDISLGFNYYRLNLRTPCEGCLNRFIVNTNHLYGVMLNFGMFLNY